MNYKIVIVLSLAVIAFVNNLVCHFDTLQDITEKTEIEVLYIDNGGNGNVQTYLKVLSSYLIYFVFYYNYNDPLSILSLVGIGG